MWMGTHAMMLCLRGSARHGGARFWRLPQISHCAWAFPKRWHLLERGALTCREALPNVLQLLLLIYTAQVCLNNITA